MRANVLIERNVGPSRARGKAIGSGVILQIKDREALIVTNRHVVDDDFPSSDHGSNDADRLTHLGGMKIKTLGPAVGDGKVVWLAPDRSTLLWLLRGSQAKARHRPPTGERSADKGRRPGFRDRQSPQPRLVAHPGRHLAIADARDRLAANTRDPNPGGDEPRQQRRRLI